MVAGVAIGGVVGALAGKYAAQKVNPTTEDAYWETHYTDRSYVGQGESYDTYRPAYRHGVEAYTRSEGKRFEEVEPQMSKEWENVRGNSPLPWEKARPAAQDAYERLSQQRTQIGNEVVEEDDIERDIRD